MGGVNGAVVKCAYLLRVSIDELNVIIYILILSNLLQYAANNVGTICTVDVVIAVEVGVFGNDNLDGLSGSLGCRGGRWCGSF
jgi:hypothetical protein